MAAHKSQRGGTPRYNQSEGGDEFAVLLKGIRLREPSASLFDRDAEEMAKILAANRDLNKSSQIRRFYDELLRHQTMARRTSADVFPRQLPFIRMMNAKAAYAKERKLVDQNFRNFMRAILDQVEDFATLAMACTLFEAVIGFSPKERG